MKVDNKHKQFPSGFTLLELLIAISIFSVLSVMAYGGLKTVLDSRDANQKTAKRVADVQLAMLRVSNDLQHAAERTVRDAFGTPLPSMMTSQTESTSLEWTRAGYSNLGEFKRSDLQRVAYNLKENEFEPDLLDLVRITWPVLDRTQGTEPVESIIISGVESIEWNFNNRTNTASSNWPITTGTTLDIITLPRAIELNMTFEDIGKIRRVILIP